MAVYKVIQDVEAEDKLLGPLSFKGFIYAIITGVLAFINFRLILIASPVKWAFIAILAGPMFLFAVLASPLGRDQPTEVWLLSRIRYFLKPRGRVWDQEGIEELVTITAPKRIEEHLTKDISQTEVHSRLKTLASTLDTRGWAIKNVDLNLNDTGLVRPSRVKSSDRLVADSGYVQSAAVIDIHPADDILDEQNNPTAQKFASMMQDADEKRKKEVLQTMRGLIEPESKTKKAGKKHSGGHKKNSFKSGMPSQLATKGAEDKKATPAPVTPERQAVNMELAQSGSAFSVATLSQLANRPPRVEQNGPNEVTISLH
jgi:hypothetical protein